MPHTILSPLPGTFYQRSAPDQPPYKSPGEAVAAGDVIGLVEVMKSFHEVRADAVGTLISYVADHEEPVMAGQPLAEID